MGMEEKAFWIVIGVVAVLAIGGFFALGSGSDEGANLAKANSNALAAQNPSGNVQVGQGAQEPPVPSAAVQDVYMRALSTGAYDKGAVTVQKGIPVRLHFSADRNAGCGKVLVMRNFNVRLTSLNGEEKVAEFTPQEAGNYEYACTMRMFRGTMQVV